MNSSASPSSPTIPLGRALRALRELRGLQAKHIAQTTGIKATRLSGIETGKVDPRGQEMERILGAIGASFSDLDRIREVGHPQ